MSDEFANNPFAGALSGLAKSRQLPKQSVAGKTAEALIKQARRARKARKTGDADYDRECELFMRHMEGVDQNMGGGSQEGNVFLDEVGSFAGLLENSSESMKKKDKKNRNAAAVKSAEKTAGTSAKKTAQAAKPVAAGPAAQSARDGGIGADDQTMTQLLDPESASMADLLASDETDPAFARAMRDVQPLKNMGREVVPAVENKVAPPADGNALQDFLDSKLEFALSCTDEYIEGYVVGLDLLTVGRLRQGGFSPEAHLDLHGMNIEQAFESLRAFIKSSYLRGMRCLILVPGRGRNSPDGIGVLREKMRMWLTQDPFKRVVLAFCTAQPHDGGPGSLYVLLRKYKKKGRVYWDRTPADSDLY